MRRFIGDFETKFIETENKTKVWAAASIDLEAACDPENVTVLTSIEEYFEHVFSFKENCNHYFVNLRFDGNYILNYVANHFNLYTDEEGNMLLFNQGMPRDGYYSYMVSSFNEWYSITVSHDGFYYTFRDLVKLIPLSVEEMGEAFDTKYRKLEMDYTCHDGEEDTEITEEQLAYIKNDVLVPHEALNEMIKRGYDRGTIGSCCIEEFKKTCNLDPMGYAKIFQDFTKWESRVPGYDSVDAYLREAYHGGWCYVNPKKAGKQIGSGCHVDKNSMYPSKMATNLPYPVGRPTFFFGEIPEEAKADDKYYFVRFKCAFYLKKGKLPTVQIKGDPNYMSNEWLETSDYEGNKYEIDIEGNVRRIRPTMVMTQTDFELFLDHYDVKMLEILDGCYFYTNRRLFNRYVNKYMDMKVNAKTKGERTIAKLFLNNLSGRMGARKEADFKQFGVDEGLYGFGVNTGYKKAGTISIAAAITSYARRDCIESAQKFHDMGKFIYSDTDSIAVECSPEEVSQILKLDPKALDCWKVETTFDFAKFIRQKCYMEHVIEEDCKEVNPYYNVKCAGLGKQGKKWLTRNLENGTIKLKDFKAGLIVKENLRATSIDGGVILQESNFVL